MRPRLLGAVATALALTATVAACTSSTTPSSSSPGRTLVVETAFQLQTLDPARLSESTELMIDRAVYDTLLTYRGGDVKTPVADVATGYSAANDAKTFVFTLNPKAVFANGDKVTAADVVFSLDRVKNIAGGSSYLMAGITATARGTGTVVLTSSTPNAGIPAIVTNPALGILDEAVVTKDGGSDAANAATADRAENALDAASAGSGPYTLTSYSTTTQVVITANPRYWGTKPTYHRIIIRNAAADVQKIDVGEGASQIAVDLSPAQAKGMSGVHVLTGTSPAVFFLILNQSTKISKVTPNLHFQRAVRLAIDYAGLAQLAGAGAVQAAGIIPSALAGSLPPGAAFRTNLPTARAALAKTPNRTPHVTITFPAQLQVNGVSFATLATQVQRDLGDVGIQATLQGSSTQTALASYRAGTEEIGLWDWGPDFPDPADYLAFLPGGLVGLRANWKDGADLPLEAVGARAAKTANAAVRAVLYQQIQRALNANSPFIPLIQPPQILVAGTSVKHLASNPVWLVNLTELG
jgi:peptide/nickel transport system substrate-binding protein